MLQESVPNVSFVSQTYVTSVYLDVAYACNGFQVFSGVSQVFHTYVASVSVAFGCMLQVFHLNVAKVDRVLHMLQWGPPVVAAYCSC
jgi:hypothetical protein